MIRVIVNGYNCKPFVKDCITSIKKQNTDFRCIVVDDGSTDGTPNEIVRHLDYRFELIVKEKNEGPAAARFKALETLRADASDLVVLVDLDDRLNAVNALKIAEDAKVELTYGSTLTKSGKLLTGAYPEEVIRAKSFREYKWLCFPLRTFRYGLYKRCNFTADDFKYHKKVRINGKQYASKGDWYKVCTDVALMHPLLENAQSIKQIREPLYFYNDKGKHIGRSKYPIELWHETNRQINEKGHLHGISR